LDPIFFSSEEEEEEETAPKNQRDDLVNPFWIDDRDLKNGTIDFLPGSEQQFWKDLIEKYLEAEPIKTKEVVAKQKKTAEDLKTLRNQMVRLFFDVFISLTSKYIPKNMESFY
jgi:chitin synthase